MTDQTLLWDDATYFVLIPLAGYESALAAFRFVLEARTLGEVRNAELPWWGESLLEDFESAKAEAAGLDDPAAVSDSELWDLSLIKGLSPFEHLTTPWDAEQLVDWLDHNLNVTHMVVGGGSPAGHIDTYSPRDREALFTALREAGYELEQRPGLYDEYSTALDAVEAWLV